MTRRGPARVWMLVTAVLAVSAAFGLHPEPSWEIPTGDLEISTIPSVSTPAASHECLACRAHRPLVSAPAPLAVAAPERSEILRGEPRSIVLRSIPLPPSVGRAPPASA